MVACCDTETGHEIVGNSEDGGLEQKRCPKSLNAAVQRNADNEGDIEPVDMLIPVCFGDGSVGDVRLFWIIFCASVWLRRFSHGTGL